MSSGPVLRGTCLGPACPTVPSCWGTKTETWPLLRVLWGARPEPQAGGHQQEAVGMVLPQLQPPWAQTLWRVPAAGKQQLCLRTSKVPAGPAQVVRAKGSSDPCGGSRHDG